MTLAAGAAFAEGVGGDSLIDETEPVLLFVSLVLQFAAIYNLIVGAVQRGILDSRY